MASKTPQTSATNQIKTACGASSTTAWVKGLKPHHLVILFFVFVVGFNALFN